MPTNTWTGGAGDTDWNDASNWSEANWPGDSGHTDHDIVIPDTSSISNPALHAHITCNSLSILASGTITGGGYRITVSDKSTASGSGTYSVFNAGTISGNLDLTLNTSSNNLVRFAGSSGNCFKEVRLNASPVFEWVQNAYIESLVIAAGTLQPYNNAYNLTVEGSTSITSTLNCLGSTISLGHNVDGDWSVTVNAGGTFIGGTGNHYLGAVTLNSSSNQFTWATGNTYLSGRGSSGNQYKIFNNFTAGKVTAAGTVIVDQARTPLAFRCDDTSGINNLTMNCGATRVLHLEGDLTVGGDLNISAGEITTRNHQDTTDSDLTVTGKTIIGDGSAAANVSKLIPNSSTLSLGASYTGDYGLKVRRGGTLVGGSGQHTFGSFSNEDHADSITTLTTHANGTTLSSEYSAAGANGYALAVYDDSTFDDADGLVVYAGPSADTYLSGKTLHNVTVNTSGNTIQQQNGHTFNGDLVITAGTWDTHGTENNALTVVQACDIGTAGNLDLNGSTVSLGTLAVGNGASASLIFSSATTTITLNPNSTHPTWGFGLGSAATVNMNGGTIKFAKVDAGTRYLQMAASGVHPLNAVEVDTSVDIPWAGHFEADSLDIQDGNLNSYGGTSGITITKGLIVGNGSDAASLGYTSDSNGFHDQSFGGITINNNGTFNASNQTTYITGHASLTANRCFKCSTSGVLALNGGTLNVTGTDWGGTNYAHFWVPDGFDFGNVTINAGGADAKYYQFREGSGTMHFGNVYVKSGEWRDYDNNNTFNIRGNVDVGTKNTGGTNAAFFGSDARDNAYTTKAIIQGIANVHLNGQFHVPYGSDGTDGCKVGGIREVVGTVYGDTA